MPRRPLYMERSDEWLLTLSRKLRSPGTVELYGKCLGYCWDFAREAGWPSDPRRIQPEHVWAWYQEIQNLSTGTQKLRIWTLLKFLAWCGNVNVRDVEMKITVSRSRVDWLTVDQVGQMVAECATPWELATVTILAYTGARAGELSELRLREAQPTQLILRGKGRKERAVPVDAEFWDVLSSYLEYRAGLKTSSDRFLVKEYRRQVTEYNTTKVEYVVRLVADRCGFHCSPHTLRRSFGRHLWLQGCSVEQISKLLGHSSIEMTIKYLGINDMDLRNAIAQFRPSYASKTYLKRPSQ